MTKYSDIEIETAQNLLEHDFMWLARNGTGRLYAHPAKPVKVNNVWGSVGLSSCVCYFVPIFQSIRFDDKEPVSLESIVHPQILDDAEKRYLENVIRPFRDKASFIMKHHESLRELEQIIIGYKSNLLDDNDRSYFGLPPFKSGAMYEGMESDLKYSLEELGL